VTEEGLRVFVYEANFAVNEELHVKSGDWFYSMG